MTIPDRNSATPTRIFQPLELNLEIETALLLEKFKEQLKLDGKAVIKFNKNSIEINPKELVRVIRTHFNHYIELLKNPNNVILRQNFEKRFNCDNSLKK
jgi:hypothetical protein